MCLRSTQLVEILGIHHVVGVAGASSCILSFYKFLNNPSLGDTRAAHQFSHSAISEKNKIRDV